MPSSDNSNYEFVRLSLHKEDNADIWNKLQSVPLKTEYIKDLIRADISNSKYKRYFSCREELLCAQITRGDMIRSINTEILRWEQELDIAVVKNDEYLREACEANLATLRAELQFYNDVVYVTYD